MLSTITTKLKKYLIKNLTILLHNIVLQVILTIIFGASFLQYIGILNNILIYKIQFLKIGLILIGLYLIGKFLLRYIISKKGYNVTIFGLGWRFLPIMNKIPILEGPFCLCSYNKHDFSFDSKLNKHIITCSGCLQRFENEYDTIEALKKATKDNIKYALVKNNALDFQFNFESIDKVNLWIENKSFFEVENLNIRIFLDVNGNNELLLDYLWDKMDSKSKHQIDDELLKDNLRKKLENTGFIKIHYLGCLDICDNGYCEEIIEAGEYHLSLKEEFNTTLTITTKYSIINKKKCIDTKYLIQFRKHALDGSTERYPYDDCLISVNKTK